ncbi:MAG: LamG domain-containing protein [Cyclobacteriaceae bacterium]|nr:LamG domain-containing protein [Cyclobacteriaceae bacterium]
MIPNLSLSSFCVLLVLTSFYSCNKPAENDTAQKHEGNPVETDHKQTPDLKPALAKALTFHAPFDQGPDAGYGKGDLKLYTGNFSKKNEEGKAAITPGLGEPALRMVQDGGKYGHALEFPADNETIGGYHLENNIAFSESNFQGTISLWMKTDTEALPGLYCDPIQLTDKDYASDAIWFDITKNDVPPDLRLGVYGDQPTWDPENLKGKAEAFFLRMAKMSEPPFSPTTWTHVALTWEGLNTDGIGRAWLYVNGKQAGRSGPIREPFNWDMAQAHFRLGIGYTGMFDDIALFNRALTLEEIKFINKMEGGISELYQ